jgi:hypothetical protein
MRAATLACQKSPGHDLELGGASNKPEPVVERIANRLQLERALRALRAEGLHAENFVPLKACTRSGRLPLVAQCGHSRCRERCPLSGVKRT